MQDKIEILVLGASYESPLGSKLALAGALHLICLPQEAGVTNANGVKIRMPVRGCDKQSARGRLIIAISPASGFRFCH